MLIYEFLERRFDQLYENDSWIQAEYMVDGLWDSNYLTFKQEDKMVNDICKELSEEMDSVANEDIPF